MQVSGLGVQSHGVLAGITTAFTVHTNQADNARLQVVIKNPEGKCLHASIQANAQGESTVTYCPDVVGCYNVAVKYAGSHVPNSPFLVKAGPAGDDIKAKLPGSHKMTKNGRYFFLKNPGSGLVMDVLAGRRDPAVKVGVWTRKEEENNNQLWYFHHHTGTIRTRLNDFCLDVKDGDLVMNPFDTYHTKRWTIMGNRICLEDASDQVVEIAEPTHFEGSPLRLGVYDADESQHWALDFAEPHCFFIKSKLVDNVMRVASSDIHAAVVMDDEPSSQPRDMLWYEDEWGYVRSYLNGFALDVDPSSLMMMTPFDADNKNQRWVVEGEFIVNHDREDVPVLDIVGSNKKNGAEVCAYQRSGTDNQRWDIEYI